GAATINYGVFLNTIINFIIVAFALFLVIRAVNKAQEARQQEEAAAPPPPPPAPSAEEKLLTEIRDLIKSK
ncbi:MAG: MscL family protein, partial [Chloroflexi bacterium]|nr:MscL family protein [Chloroflexota bacterium]